MITWIRRLRHGPLRCLGPLWRPLGKVYRLVFKALPFGQTTRTRIGHCGPFLLDGRFAFSNFENWGESSKNAGFKLIVSMAKDARCIFDLGAHVGLISLPLSQNICPGGKIYAFEPGDVNRQLLKRHLALNHITNVEVFDALVGQTDQTMVPFYQADGDNPMNTVAPKSEGSNFSLTKKPQVSIDGMCERFGLSPDIVKIDVEGAELEVVRGAQATLKRCQPTLFLSVHPRQIKELGHSLNELVGLVRESGYEFFDLNGRMCDDIDGSEYLVKPKTTPSLFASN